MDSIAAARPFGVAGWGLVLSLAIFGAIAGWFVIDHLGRRPGRKGLLRDIAIALLALVLTFSVASAGILGPLAIMAPMIMLFSLANPMTAAAAIIGCAVLLAYARLTVAKVTPPTSPPA